MKKIFIIAAALFMTASVWAQSPEKMSYQAVVRDASNTLVVSQPVGMQISILKGGTSGTPMYVETQTPTTNANGLVSFEIGAGNLVSGDITNIDWSNDTYFIKTETDPTGGTTYTITGISQLLSVPYALHAKTAGSIIRDTLVGYVHSDTIGNFELKTYNGIHNFYEVSASHDLYNSATQQYAIVGVTKDNHDPVDPDNDTRAMLVHSDNLRALTKLVVLEPGELTIAVLDANATGTSPLAIITMKDSTEELIIGNSYSGMGNMQNLIRLGKESTTMEFIDINTGTSSVFEFGENGLALYNNGVIVWGINSDGSNFVPASIGDFRDGGIVIATDQSGQHGLVADINDLGANFDWGCDGTDLPGADGTGFGDGAQNTTDIYNNCQFGGIAAHACVNSTSDGYTDWFLPGKDAINSLYINKSIIDSVSTANGGSALINGSYWSSSEVDASNAWSQDFSNGASSPNSKLNAYNVRAVRLF